jgi:predicted nucleic acid-binding protein
MKHEDATQPAPLPSADDDGIPELTAWIGGISTAARSGLAITEQTADFAFELPTLYLDTTIVSYLAARLSRDALIARNQTITRRWWQQHRARHAVYVSHSVLKEAEQGDADAARERLDILVTLPKVHESACTHELAARIFDACRLPARAYEDAHHAALATIHGLDVLLTWNCTHLANPNMIAHIRRACEAYGYAPPAIYTPEQLIGVCAYGRSDS